MVVMVVISSWSSGLIGFHEDMAALEASRLEVLDSDSDVDGSRLALADPQLEFRITGTCVEGWHRLRDLRDSEAILFQYVPKRCGFRTDPSVPPMVDDEPQCFCSLPVFLIMVIAAARLAGNLLLCVQQFVEKSYEHIPIPCFGDMHLVDGDFIEETKTITSSSEAAAASTPKPIQHKGRHGGFEFIL
jgi:hypothetical protein